MVGHNSTRTTITGQRHNHPQPQPSAFRCIFLCKFLTSWGESPRVCICPLLIKFASHDAATFSGSPLVPTALLRTILSRVGSPSTRLWQRSLIHRVDWLSLDRDVPLSDPFRLRIRLEGPEVTGSQSFESRLLRRSFRCPKSSRRSSGSSANGISSYSDDLSGRSRRGPRMPSFALILSSTSFACLTETPSSS